MMQSAKFWVFRELLPHIPATLALYIKRAPRRSRPETEPRTLENVIQDHAAFIQNGANIKEQSKFHNAVHSPILSIPVNTICPPYLHILLGITKKHHDLMEAQCHQIDLSLAIDQAKQGGTLSGQLFDRYVSSMKEKVKLETKISKLESKIEEFEENCSLATLAREDNNTRHMKSKLIKCKNELDILCKKANLKPGSGPVTANLDTILQNHNIHRQKYHGKSFVGNDCNKYLQKQVYRDVCAGIVTKTEELTQSIDIISEAISIKTKFTSLFTMFSKIHKLVSHRRTIDEQELVVIQKRIDEYLAYFRGLFQKTRITIKQHLLEDHIVTWIRQWGFGMALHGEQGGESIHAQVNEMTANARGIVCPLKRTLSVLQDHLTLVSPTIPAKRPIIVKRSKKSTQSSSS